jgi:hypothetical protein
MARDRMANLARCLIAGSLVAAFFPAVRSASSPASEAGQVAVVEFTAASSTPEDWAYGLADLLAIELQRRGVVLIERRDVRWILAERHRSFLFDRAAEPAPFADLPQLQGLISGTIRRMPSDRFHLLVSRTDPRTGIELASAEAAGRWPSDIPAALSSIAIRLITGLEPPPDPLLPQRPSGFSRSPEVAWLFYRGIAHCLADEPEWGAVYFLEAIRVDPHFTAARVWSMRAFELLGFTELVQVARSHLLRTPDGVEALRQLDQGDWFASGTLVLALLISPHQSEEALRVVTQLRQAIERTPGLLLFEPDRITALAAEMDLQLTARFGEATELARMAWTAVHGVLSVEPDGKRLRLVYRPALIARPAWTHEVSTSALDIESAARDIARLVQQPSDGLELVRTGSRSRARPSASVWVAPPSDQPGTRAGLSATFRELRDHPRNREAWLALLRRVEWLDDAHMVGVLDQLIALVNLREPNASVTLSGLLWDRWFRRSRGRLTGYGTLPIREEFAPLLVRHSDSLAADYVRAVQALECFEREEYTEAAERFLELEPQLKARVPDGLVPAEYWACYYAYTAAALRACGRLDEAIAWFTRADKVFDQHPTLNPYRRVDGFWGRQDGLRFQLVWTNPFPARHNRIGPEPTLREAVQHALAGPPPRAVRPNDDLERLFEETHELSGWEVVQHHRRRVMALIDYKNRYLQGFQTQLDPHDLRKGLRSFRFPGGGSGGGAYTAEEGLFLEACASLNRLICGTLVKEEFQFLQETARQLAAGVSPSLAAHALESAGLYEDARRVLERHLADLDARPIARKESPSFSHEDQLAQQHEDRVRAATIADLARLWGRLGQPAIAAELLRAELDRPKADFFAIAGQVASYWIQAGRADLAGDLYRQYAGQPLITDRTRVIARLCLANCEMERGHFFEAIEILRELLHQCDGTNWLSNRGQLYFLRQEILDRLALARRWSSSQVQSRDWEPPQRSSYIQVPHEPDWPDSAAVRDLQDLFHAALFWVQAGSADDFIQRHGRAAMPALWRMLEVSRLPTPRVFLGCRLLDRLAEPVDAPQVLELFKLEPWVARTAFRLDPAAASQILRERFGVFARQEVIPSELVWALEKYRLTDQYPVLLSGLLGPSKWIGGNTIIQMDRMLARDATPELEQQFRDALAHRLELRLGMGSYQDDVLHIARIAVRWGVRQGIDALLRAPAHERPSILGFLREHMDLPADPDEAWRVLERTRGAWQWDPQRRQFESPTHYKPL